MRVSATLLLALAAACSRTEPPAAGPEPIEVCLVEQGKLIGVAAEVTARGDTLVRGVPVAQADSGEYAAGRAWYEQHTPFDYNGVCYMQFGAPRTVPRERLRPAGWWRGVAVFAEADDRQRLPAVLYLAVAPGCVFQLHQWEAKDPPTACPQPPHRFQNP